MNLFCLHMRLCLLAVWSFLLSTKLAIRIVLHPLQGLIEAAQCTWMHG